MATSALASLVVSIEANVAKFSTDMQRAADTVDKTAKQMQSAASGAMSAMKGLVAAFAVNEIYQWGSAIVSAAGNLNDLSQATGSAVEDLSALQNQAYVSGVSADTLSTSLYKLAAGMSGTGKGSKEVTEGLRLLGVTAKDPAEAMKQAAIALDKYADGVEKAALTRALFAKSGPEFNAFMHDLASNTREAATVTTEQARAADQLEESLRRLSVQGSVFKTMLLSDIVPAMNTVISSFVAGRMAGMGFWEALFAPTGMDNTNERLAGYQAQLDKLRADEATYEAVAQGWSQINIGNTKKEIAELERKVGIYTQMRNILAGQQPGVAIGVEPPKPAAPKLAGPPVPVSEYEKAYAAITKMAVDAASAMNAVFTGTQANPALKKLQELADDPAWKKIPQGEQEILKARLRAIDAMYDEAEASKRLMAAYKAELDATDKFKEEKFKANAASWETVTAYKAETEQMAIAVELMGLDAQTRAVLTEQIKNETAALALEEKGMAYQAMALRNQLQARIDVINKGFAKENYQQLYSSISDGITDAIMRGFENSKGFVQSIIDYMKDAFNKLVLRPIIQALIQPIVGGAAGMLSGGAGASGGGGIAGNGLSLISSGISIAGGGSMFGAALGAGYGAGVETLGILAAGGSAAGVGGMGAVLGAGMAVAGPWIAAAFAAYAIYQHFAKQGGGPKVQGYAESAGFVGGMPAGWSTPDRTLDSTVSPVIAGMQKSYAGYVKAFGGTNGAGEFAMRIDTDPRGTAKGGIGATAQIGGKTVYMSDPKLLGDAIGRGEEAMTAAMKLESSRAVLAALQASDLPKNIANILNAIPAATATQESIEKLIALATTVAQINDMLASVDALTGSVEDLDALLDDTATGAFARAGDSLGELIDTFDGSEEATAGLVAASNDYYRSLVSLLGQIKQVTASINAMFAGTEETFNVAGRDTEWLRRHYSDQAESAYAGIKTAKDPAEVARFASQGNQALQNAWNLLSPEQQKLQRDYYIQSAKDIDTAATNRLQEIGDAATSEFKTAMGEVKTLLEKVAADMQTAANTQQGAANTQVAAANTPIHVVVDTNPVPDTNG